MKRTLLQQIEELKLQEAKGTKTEKGTRECIKGAGAGVVLLRLFADETYVLYL